MSDLFPSSRAGSASSWEDAPDDAFSEPVHSLDLLQAELALSGHQHTIQNSAPALLQRFFSGEIDLDTELGRRFEAAPLVSTISVRPEPPAVAVRSTAELTTQDNSASLVVDISRTSGVVELGFTLGAMLSLRFQLNNLPEVDRRRWLALMRREQGVAFLWSRARWERDYMIFSVRKYNIRAYAFSPRGYEAAIQMTPDVLETFLNWLEGYWF